MTLRPISHWELMDIKKQFGQAVKKYRQNLGISQEQLALKANLHRTYVGAIERGERNISLENIEKLVKALEIFISDLFKNIKT